MGVSLEPWESHGRADALSWLDPAPALRHVLLWASRRALIKRAITRAPLTRGVVRRFVAGEDVEAAVTAARRLAGEGMLCSLDHLGEDTRDARAAQATVAAYRRVIARLEAEGLAGGSEVSLKLSAVGQALDGSMALDNAAAVCEAARAAGALVTVDMEDHTTTDSTLGIMQRLRADFPSTGAVVQAALFRSPDDCRALGHPGSRVRLCKGAYQEPAAVAWQTRAEVRTAYLRCLGILVHGGAHPMVATHDPLLIAAARRILPGADGARGREFQMLYGIRPDEQRRLVAAGERVRIYVPFGTQWYGYLMRRMAERPGNLALVLRALAGRS
jgi:proline dehydrogenase